MGNKQRIGGKLVNAVAFRDSGIGTAEEAPGSGAGNDSTDLTSVASDAQTAAEYLWVGASGAVVITSGGSDLTLGAVVAGVWHPMPPFTRVKATGTTATGVHVGYPG